MAEGIGEMDARTPCAHRYERGRLANLKPSIVMIVDPFEVIAFACLDGDFGHGVVDMIPTMVPDRK
jgi:hypothetical protein